ncbi:MAG TPA: 2-C-methyl-D-erythritol 2,4-cyclodiphosphate synthase [bacterium]|nr:2-C-methyl-D-erythritol 2,4-cyclodiphosphate synthase [bacterium]
MSTNISGIGYDSHKLVKGKALIIGGVIIESEFGLLAHSDGDVLCHALIDAILGASGKDDIGTLFPDTDEKWKNADSIKMLSHVVDLVKNENIELLFLDSVVIMENIKLRPYINEIKKNIAKATGIDVNRINIKAKTNEKMGFVGRNEGVAVMAIANVKRSF